MRKNLFGMVIVAAALLAALSAGPACAANLAGNPSVQTAKSEACPAAPTPESTESTVPSFMNPPERRLGFCHCGCSSQRTCRTSADCGGASCDQAISCC